MNGEKEGQGKRGGLRILEGKDISVSEERGTRI